MSAVRSCRAARRDRCETLRAGGALCALLLPLACADTRGAETVPLDNGLRMDAGFLPVEQPSADAARDTPRTDTPVMDCVGDTLVFPTIETDGRSFAVAVDGNDVALLYLGVGCQGVGLPRDPRALWSARFTTTGSRQTDPDAVTDSCLSLRTPTLLTRAPGDLAAYFFLRAPEGIVLASHALGSADALGYQAVLPSLDGHLAAALLGPMARPSVAYVVETPDAPADRGSIISVWQHELTSEVLPAASLHHAVGLELVQAGESASGTLLWVSDRPEHAGVYLRSVDQAGRANGEPVQLTAQVGVRSAVVAAARSEGAGIVYTEPTVDGRHALRFRYLAADGVVGAPVALLEAGDDIAQPAIAAYRNGFAIAYRRIGSDLNRQVGIRLLFIDEQGKYAGQRGLADTTLTGSAVQLRTARDGRLIVVWDALAPPGQADEADGTSRLVHVARQACY